MYGEQLPAALKEILASAQLRRVSEALGSDTELYLVGGTVRDAFLGIAGTDLDLSSPLLPVEVVKRAERAQLRVIPTGLSHQTVTILSPEDGATIELTTLRGEGISTERRVVSTLSIKEDLSLRDFTVNAIALRVNDEELVDPFNGREDIKAKVIRAVRDASQRFAEDPLRIMRMIRFAVSHRFDIDEKTYDAAKALVPKLTSVSPERIRDEFNKILISTQPARGLRKLSDLGILELLIPELQVCVNFEQNRFHTADVFEHTLAVVEAVPPELTLRLAALFHDIGKPPSLTVNDETGDRHFYRHETIGADITTSIMQRLRYSTELQRSVSDLVRLHMRPTNAGPAGLRRLLRDTGELFSHWRVLKEADAGACKLGSDEVEQMMREFDLEIERIRSEALDKPFEQLALRGHDLLDFGLAPGPIIGEILRALQEIVLDDPSQNSKGALLARVPELVAKLSPE